MALRHPGVGLGQLGHWQHAIDDRFDVPLEIPLRQRLQHGRVGRGLAAGELAPEAQHQHRLAGL